MEKKLKRQILFKKVTPTAFNGNKKSTAAEIDEIGLLHKVTAAPPQPGETTIVVHWIKTHPLFKWSGMCAQLGIDRGNFNNKVLKAEKPVITPELLDKIIGIIVKYGYQRPS